MDGWIVGLKYNKEEGWLLDMHRRQKGRAMGWLDLISPSQLSVCLIGQMLKKLSEQLSGED